MRIIACSLLLALTLTATAYAQNPVPRPPRPSRTFQFTYHAAFTPPANTDVRAWIPIPPTTADQTVQLLSAPSTVRFTTEHTFGNRLAYFEARSAPATPVQFDFTFRDTRYEDRGQSTLPNDQRDTSRFLKADALVPVGGKALQLLQGRLLPDDPVQRAHLLYDLVDDHMQYRKDKPGWGTGNADWAFESCFGNCTDFHSLFIALARSQHLPAKFEIGFMLPADRAGTVPGYHCWAKFQPPGKGWIPVDISDANQHPEKREANFGVLDPNRILFTTGRDLILDPPQHAAPINFLVYPYIELDGTPLPQDQIGKRFGFKDVLP